MNKTHVSLNRIRKSFPNVEKVVNAKKPVLITVTPGDNSKASKKDPNNCALAQACKRQFSVDGAIIGISVSYLIKGKIATRFKTSETVSREITSFDRHHDFQPGRNYRLSQMSPSDVKSVTLGGHSRKAGNGKKLTRYHHTENIRTIGAV